MSMAPFDLPSFRSARTSILQASQHDAGSIRMGPKASESPIERHHNLMNRWNRIFANMRTFKRRFAAQHKHMSKIANHDVQSIIANITAATKRTESAISAQKKADKEEQHLAEKKRKVGDVKEKVEKGKHDEDDDL
jgi:hypothetical protein